MEKSHFEQYLHKHYSKEQGEIQSGDVELP